MPDRVNILMVDDQPQKLLSYEAMLEGLGERLLRAQSGNEAFEILLQEEVAVILLDVNMPGMVGFETASVIREHPRFAKTPIIFVTAVNTTDLDRIRGYEIGAVDYVSVPVIPEILRAKVAVFAELHRKTRELTESERHIRAILESATDAIVTIDERGVMQTINPATERIFDYSAADMAGNNLAMLMFMPDHGEFERLMADLRDPKRRHLARQSREVLGKHRKGVIIPLEIAVSEVAPGKTFTAIIRDVSVRKELEREITEIAAMEQRRIGQELHDGVSQELTGLTLMATSLKDQLKEEVSSSEALAGRLMAGLRQVHKHVRAVAHGLIPVDVDAEGLRSALEELADRIAQQAGVACLFHCPQPVLVKDALTATHLFYIVQEAVNNALRHGRPRQIDIT